LLKYAQPLDDSNTMPDHPDITWKEFMDLSEDCRVFDNMRQLNQNSAKFSPAEQTEIVQRFDDKYRGTKFWKLFNEGKG